MRVYGFVLRSPLSPEGGQKPDDLSRLSTAHHREFGGELGGTPGETLISRLEDVLPTMEAADAADVGGIATDPRVILPPTHFYETTMVDAESLAANAPPRESDPPGGPPDTFFDAEADLAARRESEEDQGH